MSILSDADIRAEAQSGRLRILPWSDSQLQPASYDVTLGTDFKVMRPVKAPFFDYIDAGQRKTYDDSIGGFVSIEHYEYESDEYTIGPGEFVLGTTIERIHIPRHMSARFEGKSSLGRIGLMTHVTAGFVDPGFSGNITLEIHNVSPNSVKIHSGDPIGQLCFYYLHTPATELYGQRGNHYQGQIGTTVVRH